MLQYHNSLIFLSVEGKIWFQLCPTDHHSKTTFILVLVRKAKIA